MARIWDLISNETLASLMLLQHKHYPKVKLKPPEEVKQAVTVMGNVEDIEEIDKLMRQPPRFHKGAE